VHFIDVVSLGWDWGLCLDFLFKRLRDVPFSLAIYFGKLW
jgi:hypothetical protein